jgi:hypothetical protein
LVSTSSSQQLCAYSFDSGVVSVFAGPWIQADDMGWNGDYTLDYNFQSEYYGVFSSNHAELAENYYPVILAAVPIGRRRAAYPHWGDRTTQAGGPGRIQSGWNTTSNGMPTTMGNYSGVEMPSHTQAYGGYYMSDLGTRGIVGWVALPFVDNYDYTMNRTFLEETAYPLLIDGADFFESYLTQNTTTGAYSLDNACALEGCTLPKYPKGQGAPQRNPTMTLGWIRATFNALLRLSVVLGKDIDRRTKWEDILVSE